jgi:prophage DNA circulation protein
MLCAGIPTRARTRACHARRQRLCARRLRLRLLRVVCFRPPPLPHPALTRYSFTRMADVQPLIWGYKFTREIARRMPHFRGEPPALHPTFAPGGPASVLSHAEGPVPIDAQRIVYSEQDERSLEEFARAQGM